MAIIKKFLKTKPVCKVTFSLPIENANEVYLVGDFNKWDKNATPLKKLKKGGFKANLDLPIDQNYQYRFIVDGKYTNDTEAEALVFNEYANTENCLISL